MVRTALEALQLWLPTDPTAAALLPGGIWNDVAPQGTARPYAVVTLVGGYVRHTGGPRSPFLSFEWLRLAVYALGADQAWTTADQLRQRLDLARLPIGDSAVAIRFLNRNLVADETAWRRLEDVWQAVLDYEVVAGHSR